jgi:hypothetical protein
MKLEAGYSLRLPLLRLLGPCLVALLLVLPLWIDSAHGVEGIADSLILRPALSAETAGGGGHPADASRTVHCALHCVPQVLFPLLLFSTLLLPLTPSFLFATTRLHSRLGLPPLLPPPQLT